MEGSGMQEEVLKKLEEQLRQPDFVVEPGASDVVRRYMQARSSDPAAAELVVDVLVDNYQGYGPLGSLMCKWLNIVKGPVVEASEAAPGSSHAGAANIANQPQDEYHFLKEFVKSRFQPERFQNFFSSGEKRKEAVTSLLSHERGRQLIYELSAEHRNSLMLTFAIQKIMKQGHQDEVANMGSSLASYFMVFHGLLSNRLQTAVDLCRTAHSADRGGSSAGPSNSSGHGQQQGAASSNARTSASFEGLCRELADSCAGSQHTYLHAQMLLRHLSQSPDGKGRMFLHMFHRLERITAQTQPTTWSLMPMLMPSGASAKALEAAQVVGRLLAVGSPIGSADVTRLWRLYCGDAPKPPLAVLQHAHLLQLLLSSTFSSHGGRALSEEVQTACLELLAAATSVADSSSSSSSSSPSHPCGGASDPASGQPDSGSSPRIPTSPHSHARPGQGANHGSDTGGDDSHAKGTKRLRESEQHGCGDETEEVLERRRQTLAALRAALSLLSKAHGKLVDADVRAASLVARVPVACLGVLHAVKHQLSRVEFYSEPSALSAAAIYLRLMMTIAGERPELVQQVIDVIRACLEVQGSQRVELSKQYLQGLVSCMRDLGAVSEVIQAVDDWAKAADPSLIRIFIFMILTVLGPPYSPHFASWLLQLMVACGVQRGRDLSKGGRNSSLLLEFGTSASGVVFPTPLDTKSALLLQQLASGRIGQDRAGS
ncbi:MAG: hypothetical protein WDW38_001373 [Sanguina aurantia]